MLIRKKITLNFWNKIDNFIRKNSLIGKYKSVLIGLSGGPDSMALLHYFIKKRKDVNIVACHINHKIRGKESDSDADFVKKYCAENKIKLICKEIDIPRIAKKNKKNIEHVARQERYKFFTKTALKENCNLIATAHHLDDHIETILLNLLRGETLKGLSGIPFKRKIAENLFVIRPLMAVTKKEILDYLKANEIKYRKDHTNEDEKYTRNWIRKKLLPMLEEKQPKIKEHLLKISNELRRIYE